MYNILGLYKPIKVDSEKLFCPKLTRDYIHGAWCSRSRSGDIYIKCSNNGVVYGFKGVQTEEEFINAVLYIYIKDQRSKGVYTSSASLGYWVYTHASAAYVKRWLDVTPFVSYGL